MWRASLYPVLATALFIVAAVFVFSGDLVVEKQSAALIGSIDSSKELQTISKTAPVAPTTALVFDSQESIDARFSGVLAHVRWLIQNSSLSESDEEIVRINKQFESLADDVIDGLKKVRRDMEGFSNLTITENLALGSFYLSSDGDNEGLLINGSGGVQFVNALLDAGGNSGLSGYVLQSTGTSTAWVATSTLGIAGSLSDNTVIPNYILTTGQIDEYCLTYEATGTTWEWQSCASFSGIATSSIDSSAELAAILTDEVGTGNLVFNASPNFTGTVGFGTTTPLRTVVIDGDMQITGALYDTSNVAGSVGQILQTNGSSIGWVSTSTLGFATTGDLAGYLPLTGGSLSGSLAVGTSTNTELLSLYAANTAQASIRSGFTGSADFILEGDRLNDNNAIAQIIGENRGDDIARIAFYRDGNDDAGAIRFATQQNGSSLQEKMRLDSFGRLGIGTTTPAQRLQVFGDIRVGTTGANGCLEDYGGGTIIGSCSSDRDLKTDIEYVAETRDFIKKLAQLNVATYKWNETANTLYSKNTDIENLGLIAQDVEEVFPELISYDELGYRQVDFRAIPFYIIEALKEVWDAVRGNQQKIEQLEERIQNLEAELRVPPPASPDPEPEEVIESDPEPKDEELESEEENPEPAETEEEIVEELEIVESTVE